MTTASTSQKHGGDDSTAQSSTAGDIAGGTALPLSTEADSTGADMSGQNPAKDGVDRDDGLTAIPAVLDSPPDGGLVAWLHVLGGHLLFFNSWGLLNTFGVYESYYHSGELFDRSASDIAWIGAVQSYLLFLVGLFAGPIYDRGYFKSLIVFGSLAIAFGHMMLSLCTQYWQVLLAQGCVVGIGAGCLFTPCASILPSYFRSKLGLASGLASAGSSIGGVVYPIMLSRLLQSLGFQWAVRIIGFTALGSLMFPIAVMKMRFKAPKARALLDLSAVTDIPYVAFVFATMISFTGLSVAVFYVSFFPLNLGLTDATISFYMVAIFNAASTLGRIVPNAVSDKIGPFNTIAPCAIATGICMFCMAAVRDLVSDIIVTVLVGFFGGVFIAMPPVCFSALTPDRTKLGTRVGQGFGIVVSNSMLIGGPVAGAILGKTPPYNWNGTWIYAGVFTTIAGCMYIVIRILRCGFTLSARG
jgi:MFS family permease